MADKKISALTGASTPLAGTEVLPIVQSGSTVKVSAADITAGRAVTMLSNIVGTSPGAVTAPTNADDLVVQNNAAAGITILSPNANAGRIQFGTVSNNSNVTLYAEYNYGFDIYCAGNVVANFDTTTKNIKANAGNFVVGTAAKGVNFTANTAAAGMTSQLLNWYEEGTWTPVLYSGATDATMSGNTSGRYTRIGRVVHIHLYIETTNLNGIGGGVLAIKNLPFTVNSGFVGYAAATAGYAGNLAITAGQSVALRPNAAGTTLGVLIWSAATGTADMTGTQWTNTGYVGASFSYLI